jgi:hypothetical protein
LASLVCFPFDACMPTHNVTTTCGKNMNAQILFLDNTYTSLSHLIFKMSLHYYVLDILLGIHFNSTLNLLAIHLESIYNSLKANLVFIVGPLVSHLLSHLILTLSICYTCSILANCHICSISNLLNSNGSDTEKKTLTIYF